MFCSFVALNLQHSFFAHFFSKIIHSDVRNYDDIQMLEPPTFIRLFWSVNYIAPLCLSSMRGYKVVFGWDDLNGARTSAILFFLWFNLRGWRTSALVG